MKSRIITYSVWIISAFLIATNLWHITILPRNNDALMYTDTARDFHIYREIDHKKVILIGARSSVGGLYHGPLWQYLTYPGYIIGQGSPVTMWWWWMILLATAIYLSIYVGYKLFGQATALLYGIFTSIAFTAFNNYLINPHGVLLILPLFLYTISKFQQTTSIKYLCIHLILGTLIFQFQLAIGIPFLLLSTIIISYILIKSRKYKFFLAFLLIPLMLSNFIFFELRHNFNLTKTAFEYANPTSNSGFYSIQTLIEDRFMYFKDMHLLVTMNSQYVSWIFFLTILMLVTQLRTNTHRSFYKLMMYYYIGYFVLSFTSKWHMVDHQVYPLLGITTLVFASFITNQHKYFRILFVSTCLVIFINHLQSLPSKEAQLTSLVSKDQRSWRFLSQVATDIINVGTKNAGYFVYAPDAYGYAPRYAMIHHFEKNKLNAHEYVKKSATFVIAEAPPSDKPQMSHEWWKKEKLHLEKAPVLTKKYKNGYLWEKFELSPEEQSITYSPDINIGLHFR